jgi:hypothetical protein
LHKASPFTDWVTFGMSVLWDRGGLYTTTAGSLCLLENAMGTGPADRRHALVSGLS